MKAEVLEEEEEEVLEEITPRNDSQEEHYAKQKMILHILNATAASVPDIGMENKRSSPTWANAWYHCID